MDERNGIDGTDYWILSSILLLYVTRVWFCLSGEISFYSACKYNVLLCEFT